MHGVISPRDGIGPGQLKMRELVERVRRDEIKHIVILFSRDMQGDNTAFWVQRELAETGLSKVKLTRLYGWNSTDPYWRRSL